MASGLDGAAGDVATEDVGTVGLVLDGVVDGVDMSRFTVAERCGDAGRWVGTEGAPYASIGTAE